VSCRTYSDIPADPPQNATLEPASSTSIIGEKRLYLLPFLSSVVDPEDPYVFGPPGSGSVMDLYGSGSGSVSFHQQEEKK
jgi:hypothetical protein